MHGGGGGGGENRRHAACMACKAAVARTRGSRACGSACFRAGTPRCAWLAARPCFMRAPLLPFTPLPPSRPGLPPCCAAADLLIALAGPLTHVPQLAVWLAILFPVYHAAYGSWSISLGIPPPSEHFRVAVVAGACQLNIGLAAFNLLLPAYPLDGGRIFADCLLLAGVHVETAAKATVAVATGGGLAVIGLGIWLTSYLTIAVGVWMLYSTWQLWQVLRAGAIAQHPMFSYSAADGGGGGGAGSAGGAGAGTVQASSYRRYDGESAI
ncbi:hypothetical protein ABPG75_008662 [Micractinium tetrahymenae]